MPTKGDAASTSMMSLKSGEAASSSKPTDLSPLNKGQGSIAGTDKVPTPKDASEAEEKEENEADGADAEMGSASAEEDDLSRLEKLEKAGQGQQRKPQAKKGGKRKRDAAAPS